MPDDNAAQTVVVTGASAGLGRAIAHAFAERGARVALIARNPEALEAARKEVEALGGRALVLPLDVADAEAVEAPRIRSNANSARSTSGSTTPWFGLLAGQGDDARRVRRVTEVTYLGYVYGTLAALAPDAAARPRHHRAGRLGAGLPRHPAAVGLLRRQARHPRVHRVAALRAASTTRATSGSRWCRCRR